MRWRRAWARSRDLRRPAGSCRYRPAMRWASPTASSLSGTCLCARPSGSTSAHATA
jgi:hypothetical protein